MEDNLMTEEVTTEVETPSVETEGVAEPQVSEDSVEEGTTEESTQDETQNVDVNAIAAAARRKAEAEAKNLQANIDAEYVRRFGHLTNPKTGQPIRSQQDYLAALDAQEEMQREQEFRDKGIDPSIITKAIENNPTVLEAKRVIEQQQQQLFMNQINNEIAELGKIDPTIKSLEDVPPDVIQMSLDSKGNINLLNAYKIINYGKVNSAKEAALTQSAINQVKGKSHLAPTQSGGAAPDGLAEIPVSELEKWKAFFPDASMKELKEKYNRATKGSN